MKIDVWMKQYEKFDREIADVSRSLTSLRIRQFNVEEAILMEIEKSRPDSAKMEIRRKLKFIKTMKETLMERRGKELHQTATNELHDVELSIKSQRKEVADLQTKIVELCDKIGNNCIAAAKLKRDVAVCVRTEKDGEVQ